MFSILKIAKYWFIDNLNPIDILCSSYWFIDDLEVLLYYA